MVDENFEKLWGLFFPQMIERRKSFESEDGQFVHYTSATAAMGWLTSKEVWMRESSTMNDFMELEHGFQYLNQAYKSPSLGLRFKSVLERVEKGLTQTSEEFFNTLLEHIRNETYIACFSEHHQSENLDGRLSMWRAYGGDTPVALILNRSVFYSQSDDFNVYSAPVEYLNYEDFEKLFERVIDNLENNIEFLKTMGGEAIRNLVFQFYRFTMLCTKHSGFKEEREWRVVYSPTLNKSDYVDSKIEIVNGVPQVVYKVRLENAPKAGIHYGLTPNELIQRIIIGPTEYPRAMYAAFLKLMENAGIENPKDKIWISNIPLRT